MLYGRKLLRRPELSNSEVVAPDEEERINCAYGLSNQADYFVVVGPLTHLVPAACSAIKERACKVTGRHQSVLAGPSFSLLTVCWSSNRFSCGAFFINHRDVY